MIKLLSPLEYLQGGVGPDHILLAKAGISRAVDLGELDIDILFP